MPRPTIGDIPPMEQAQLRAELRRARYGYLLGLPILLLCAAQRPPTEIAAGLFCSRTTVYRVVQTYRAGQGDLMAEESPARGRGSHRIAGRAPTVKRSLVAIRHSVPRLCGGCRTRWSWATIPLELSARRQISVSAEPVRRWLQAVDWEWKRAKLRAKDDEPQRVEKLARMRVAVEQLRAGTALFFADEWDIHLLPKVGYQWMPKGEQGEVVTPGTKEKRYLAAALDIATGSIPHCVGSRKQPGLFLELLDTLDPTPPAPLYTHLTVVVDNAKLHKAKTVPRWLATHPRFQLLYLPTYCPDAHPIDRAFGDVPDNCTRTHTRKRMWPLVADVKQPLRGNGPWRYALSDLDYTPAVSARVAALRASFTAPAVTTLLAA